MPDESRRSVLPNGKLIDTLRKKEGWTIEDFADAQRFSSRTAQKAIAGLPVQIDTLMAIANRLDVPYESLLIKTDEPALQLGSSVQMTEAGFVLKLHIELNVSKDTVAQSEQLTAIVEMLQKLLPDKANIAIIGVVGTTAIVSVAMTPANILAAEWDIPRSGLKLLTAVGPEHYMVDGRIELLTDMEIAGVAYNVYARTYYCPDTHSPTGSTDMTQDEALIYFLDDRNHDVNIEKNKSIYLWLQRRLYSGKLRGLQERVAQWRRERKPNWVEEWMATQKPTRNPQCEDTLPPRN